MDFDVAGKLGTLPKKSYWKMQEDLSYCWVGNNRLLGGGFKYV